MGEGAAMAWSFTEADLHQANLRASRTRSPEISERTKLCLAFLHKVAHIEIAGTASNDNGDDSFVVNVMIGDNAAAIDVAKLKSGVTTASFQIQRTLKEFKDLERVVKHWSGKYPRNGFAPCPYCYAINHAHLPGGLARAAMSTDRLRRKLQELLNTYVTKSRLPRPSEIECEGFDHIPSVVTRFLTKDLPGGDATSAPASDEYDGVKEAVPMATAVIATTAAVAATSKEEDLEEEKQ